MSEFWRDVLAELFVTIIGVALGVWGGLWLNGGAHAAAEPNGGAEAQNRQLPSQPAEGVKQYRCVPAL